MQKGYFPPEWVSKLKSKCDIVQVISSYLTVNKRGNVYWALCPFHHEKTPSFAIHEDEQFYHCFGCGEGGDVIKFVQNMESITYRQAMEKLAEKVGLELPEVSDGEKIAKEKKERDEILFALNSAKDIYKENLYKETAKKAQEYVKSRKFKKSDLDNFNIGYANGNTIVNDLMKKGVSESTLLKSGIAGRDEKFGKLYDKLANRLIFPVLNSFGECLGFSGRILEKTDFKAKYKNTEQTVVFDKGSCVYAIDLLKQVKRNGQLKNVIVVEGQIDVIMMHSNGFKTAVASMGTAFTEKHAVAVHRFSDDVTLLYDGDGAGEKATLRTIGILEKEGLNVKVARLPKGQDPDEFLKFNGSEKMETLLENAVSPVEYKLNLLKEKNDISRPDGKSNYLKQAFEIINEIETFSEKDVYLKLISSATGIPIDILRRDCASSKIEKKNETEIVQNLQGDDANIKSVKYVIQSILKGETFSKIDFDIKEYLVNPVHISVLEKYKEFGSLEKLIENATPEEKAFIDDVMEYESPAKGKDYLDQCAWKIVEQTLRVKQQILSQQYKDAKDYDERKEIAEKLNKIIVKLSQRRI